jgi:hypothetical protein
MSKPEAVRMLKATVAANGVGNVNGSATDRRGQKSARSGRSTPRGTARKGGQSTQGGPVMIRVGAKNGEGPSLLQLQRDYEEKLEHERQLIKQREQELQERVIYEQQVAHANAVMETTRGLTQLRKAQQRQLHMHNKMHQAADEEKMQAAAAAVALATRQREAMKRAKEETKAEAEAFAAQNLKEERERHAEQMRSQEERLNERWQNRLDDMIEQKRRETVRAEKLLQERDTARADAQSQRRYAERVLKDKEEALRELQSKSLREKNAAIQMERDKAETARRTAMQAEAVRAAQVNLRSEEAAEIMQLATQSIKVAEEEKKKAEESLKKTEADRAKLEQLVAETEYVREEARLDVQAAKKAKDAAAERVAKMSDAMSLQNAALEAVKKSASAEKLALMKAAEEAKAAALMAVAEEREAEKKEVEAQKAKTKAAKEIAKKLGVSNDAYVPDDDDGDDDDAVKGTDGAQEQGTNSKQVGQGEIQLFDKASSRPGGSSDRRVNVDPIEMRRTSSDALSPRARTESAQLDELSRELVAALVHAEKEHIEAEAAAHREAEAHEQISSLQQEIQELQESSKVKLKDLELQLKGTRDRMALEKKHAAEAQLRVLTRLRQAYDSRLELKPMSDDDLGQCMSISASPVLPDQVAPEEDALVKKATIGICAGMRLSDTLAATAGFGSGFSTSGDDGPEPVYVQIENAVVNPFDQGGLCFATAGVAVKDRSDRWMIKWILDPPRDDSELDESAYGQQKLTIATIPEGIVIASGPVEVLARPEAMPATTRFQFDFSSGKASVTKLQASFRGKLSRDVVKEEKKRSSAAAKVQSGIRGKEARKVVKEKRETKAATKIAAAHRGKLGRQEGHKKQLEAEGWGGVFFIATRKPLICRATWELSSERLNEVAPETRVVVLETYTMDDGVVRALIKQEDAAQSLGWLTAAKEGVKSLWVAPPKVAEE